MIIRQLREKEVNFASRIVGINYSKEYENRSKQEIKAMFKNHAVKPKYLVAELNGKIVGFAGYIQSWMNYHAYELFWINVLPQYQNKGIGTALIKKRIQIIKSKRGRDKAHIILFTTKLPNFYKKLGFKILTKFKRNHYLMILRL